MVRTVSRKADLPNRAMSQTRSILRLHQALVTRGTSKDRDESECDTGVLQIERSHAP